MVSCPEWGKGQQFEEIRRINGKSMDLSLCLSGFVKALHNYIISSSLLPPYIQQHRIHHEDQRKHHAQHVLPGDIERYGN